MAKKSLIVIVSLFVVILIGFGLYVLLYKNSPAGTTQQPAATPTPTGQAAAPASYTLSVNEYNKNITGTLNLNGTTTELDLSGIDQYALVSFSSIYDIMWFQCAQGYSITNYSSTTGNKITKVDPEVNIDNFEGQHNNLTVTCTKTQ